MLGLSANLNYYLFNGNVDLRKGILVMWIYGKAFSDYARV